MPRLVWCLALGLVSCLSRPPLDPVGGFELVPVPDKSAWDELRPPALEALLAEARARVVALPDYGARIETRERIDGELFPRRVMALRVRHEPFSVAIETLEPPSEKGQRVWYDASENGGDLVAETPGFLGRLVGRVSLDPTGDLAMKDRRHPITDIGLLRLLEQVEDEFVPALARREPPRIRSGPLPDGSLRLVEALVTRESPDPPLCTRLGFDANGLLVYYGLAEVLPDGPALVEEYLYTAIEPSLGLEDEDFEPGR